MLTILRWIKNAIILGFLLFLLGFSWVALTGPMMMMFAQDQKKRVEGEIPENFPYLVLAPASDGRPTPWVLYHDELEAFQRDHPDYSFLVPSGKDSRLRDEVRKWRGPEKPAFLVLNRESDRQELQVFASIDDDEQRNVGWYEATDKSAIPRFHEAYSRSAVANRAIAFGTSVHLVFWGLIALVYQARVRRRRAHRAVA